MVALYVHFPFCLSKCPYCDFNSHVRPQIDDESWLEKILKDIDTYDGNLSITSVFFGGGTPSLMPPASAASIVNKIYKYFKTSSNIEITLEANPNSSEASRFSDFKNAGINRISIGAQSFNQNHLDFLGRKHSADEAKKAIKNALLYFDRVSFDLIYALPNQTLKEWENELNYALSFGTSHLSLYQLTIEPGTPFEMRYRRKEFETPVDNESACFYEQTVNQMSQAGLPPYEVSNFSQYGEECLHNLAYWRYEDYIGIGPGAHGRLIKNGQKIHTMSSKVPEHWLKEENPVINIINKRDQIFERLMMGLRLYSGIPKENIFDHINQEAYKNLVEEGFLINNSTQLIPTLKGILCHNSIVNYLLHDLP